MSLLSRLSFWPFTIIIGPIIVIMLYYLIRSKGQMGFKTNTMLMGLILGNILVILYKASVEFNIFNSLRPLIVILAIISFSVGFILIFVLGMLNIKRGTIYYNLVVAGGVGILICIGLLFMGLYFKSIQ